jgi:hypothetical protein
MPKCKGTLVSRAKKQKHAFYAVAKGRKGGIFFNWEDCKREVIGYTGAVFKKFKDRKEAENFIKTRSSSPSYLSSSTTYCDLTSATCAASEHASISSINSGSAVLNVAKGCPDESLRQFPSSVITSVASTTSNDASICSINSSCAVPDVVEVWSDGAARGNGKRHASKGYSGAGALVKAVGRGGEWLATKAVPCGQKTNNEVHIVSYVY